MIRRLHVATVHLGSVSLASSQIHHARDVLRLENGSPVELFDDAGNVGQGKLILHGSTGASVHIVELRQSPISICRLTVAAAVPKGDRADWMVEKLSELGVWKFIPLATARSVVLPEGKNKRERWQRLATEAAKQSRRSGVMQIDELTPVAKVTIKGWFLSTVPGAVPMMDAMKMREPELTLLIGPEGGWTEAEEAGFSAAGLTGVRLTDTILRVETAAVVAAGVVLCGPPS